MDKKLVRVMWACPNEGKTEPEAYDDRMCFTFRLGMLEVLSSLGIKEWEGSKFEYPDAERFKFHIATIGRVFTALARERIAESAVEAGMDYLMMTDDDMLGPQNLFELLYRHKADIVAPLAFSRYPPHKPVIYRINSGFDAFKRQPYFINYAVLDYPRDTLVECDAVGFGAVLIKCDILRKMEKPWFLVMSGMGEDIHFCHSARKAGFKVFMDTSVKLGHLGVPHVITEAIYDSESNQAALRGELSAKSRTS
jgi:hypothetical protein